MEEGLGEEGPVLRKVWPAHHLCQIAAPPLVHL